MLEIKNTVTERMNPFYELNSKLHMADDRISSLKICQWKLPKLKKQRHKRLKKEQTIYEL